MQEAVRLLIITQEMPCLEPQWTTIFSNFKQSYKQFQKILHNKKTQDLSDKTVHLQGSQQIQDKSSLIQNQIRSENTKEPQHSIARVDNTKTVLGNQAQQLELYSSRQSEMNHQRTRKSTQIAIINQDQNILDVQISAQDKLVIQNKELPFSIEDMIKNSVTFLPDELPNVVFSSQMTTQVYILNSQEVYESGNHHKCEDSKTRENFKSESFHHTISLTQGDECPREDNSFESTLDFNEHSQTTIVTRVDYQLTAIDSRSGKLLFNVTKSNFIPHFNQHTEQKYLDFQSFVDDQKVIQSSPSKIIQSSSLNDSSFKDFQSMSFTSQAKDDTPIPYIPVKQDNSMQFRREAPRTESFGDDSNDTFSRSKDLRQDTLNSSRFNRSLKHIMRENMQSNEDSYLIALFAVILLTLIVIAQFFYIRMMRLRHQQSEEKAKILEKQICEELSQRDKMNTSIPRFEDVSSHTIPVVETANNNSIGSWQQDDFLTKHNSKQHMNTSLQGTLQLNLQAPYLLTERAQTHLQSERLLMSKQDCNKNTLLRPNPQRTRILSNFVDNQTQNLVEADLADYRRQSQDDQQDESQKLIQEFDDKVSQLEQVYSCKFDQLRESYNQKDKNSLNQSQSSKQNKVQQNEEMQIQVYDPQIAAQNARVKMSENQQLPPEKTEIVNQLRFRTEEGKIIKEEIQKVTQTFEDTPQIREQFQSEIFEKQRQIQLATCQAINIDRDENEQEYEMTSECHDQERVKQQSSVDRVSHTKLILQKVQSEIVDDPFFRHESQPILSETSIQSEPQTQTAQSITDQFQEVILESTQLIDHTEKKINKQEFKVQFVKRQSSKDDSLGLSPPHIRILQKDKDSAQALYMQSVRSQTSFKALSLTNTPHIEQQQRAIIEKFLENGRYKKQFETIRELGRGGFGVVYQCRYLMDNNIYAIKKIKLHLGITETLQNHKVFREIQAITKLEPKNIIRYYTCWIEGLDDQEQSQELNFVNRVKQLQMRVKSKQNLKEKQLKLKKVKNNDVSEFGESGISLRSTNDKSQIDLYRDSKRAPKKQSFHKKKNKSKSNQDLLFNVQEHDFQSRKLKESINDQNEDCQRKDVIDSEEEDDDDDDEYSYYDDEEESEDEAQDMKEAKSNKNKRLNKSFSDNEEESVDDMDDIDQSIEYDQSEYLASSAQVSTSNMHTKIHDRAVLAQGGVNDKAEATEYLGGSLSMYTLQELIKQDKPYISLNLMIQTEYCSGQTLKDYIHNRGSKIDHEQNFRIFSQIINGVITIHDANIIHRDLKPENIFLDENNVVKIGDFGLARDFDESFIIPKAQQALMRSQTKTNLRQFIQSNNESGAVGTPLYFSPELLRQLKNRNLKINYAELGEKVDIYSLGLILLELSSNMSVTNHEKLSLFNMVKEQRKLHPKSKLQGSVEGDIILELTQINPEKRPKAHQIRDDLLPKWRKSLDNLIK